MADRRRFLAALAGGFLATAGGAGRSFALVLPRRGPHPEPRPGVTAAKVLPPEALGGAEDVIATFDKVRRIPGVMDGIRCHCGCADLPGFYSLLSCYEEAGMARHCHICQGEANLTFRLHSAGKTLAEIRDAIDARYG
ncbi:MAG TPA: PCYCGC motif-containing (lipo)protein [Gemmatimonadales bacterium]|nr:PCYCGC motif-containing (lipo)protein [Gemmatimonadales bacterium]